MPPTSPPTHRLPKRRPRVSRIEDRLLKAAQDAELIKERKRQDEKTMRRIVESEAEELLPRVDGIMDEVKRLKRVLVVAELAGSDKEDAIRFSLMKLSKAASL